MMNFNKLVQKENGATLIEVVASIVILVILITTFFTFFIQTSKTEKDSEHIVDSTYLAQSEMEKVYKASKNTPFDERFNAIKNLGYNQQNCINPTQTYFYKEMPDLDVAILLRLKMNNDQENISNVVIEVYEKKDESTNQNVCAKLSQPLKSGMENIVSWQVAAK